MPMCGAYFSLNAFFLLHAGRGGGGPGAAAAGAGGVWPANTDCVAPTASAPAVASRKRRLFMARRFYRQPSMSSCAISAVAWYIDGRPLVTGHAFVVRHAR